MNALLREQNMRWYTTNSKEIKMSIAKRHIGTLKDRIYKYLTIKNTLRHVDALQDILLAYSGDAGLKGETPFEVHRQFQRQQLFRQMYAPSRNRPIKKGSSSTALRT